MRLTALKVKWTAMDERMVPVRKAWCRAGVKDRKDVAPEVVRW